MCQTDEDDEKTGDNSISFKMSSFSTPTTTSNNIMSSSNVKTNLAPSSDGSTRRRQKRDKEGHYTLKKIKDNNTDAHEDEKPSITTNPTKQKRKSTKSKALMRHGKDSPSGGMGALLPSFIGLGILIFAVMAQRGFRGRASVAGIDLGTTNSVICIQAPSKSVGDIDCIKDPNTGSPIIPSVVSFVEPHERKIGPSAKTPSKLIPHPSYVIVGQHAKQRIDSYPLHTLYNAKRVLGRPSSDIAVQELQQEVEFQIITVHTEGDLNNEVMFQIDHDILITPQQVGSYVVNYLMQITKDYLGHENVNTAVLAVPAKFDTLQRQRTMEAFRNAGVNIARVLEEPTAAALAYGLHKKDGVEKILVYDFGGGTLDVSILHVSEGYCEVMGSDGDDRLGGADFDAAIAHFLINRHEEVLRNLASHKIDAEALISSCNRITDELPLCSVSSFHTLGEELKISLSEKPDEKAHAECLALPTSGPIIQTSVDQKPVQHLCESLYVQKLQITLEEYNHISRHLFDRAIIPISRLLEDLTLQPSDIDEIVMVGGTTRMPQIRDLVGKAFLNAQLNIHIDPDITVAYGAASVID